MLRVLWYDIVLVEQFVLALLKENIIIIIITQY